MKPVTEGFGPWFAAQTKLSLASILLGAGGLAVILLGSAFLLVSEGLTPYEELLQTTRSARQSSLLLIGTIMGIAGIAVGFGVYKRMPTKPARETAISGAALGIQALFFAGVYQFLRTGDKFDLLIRNNFNFDVLSGFMGDFVDGAKNTVLLAFSAQALGMALGLLLALLVLSQRQVVRAPARVYINIFRGTPLLWQISFFYFGIVLGARLPIGEYTAAILILGLNAGAYTAEIFRAGIQSLERGQMEASRSLGMSYLQAMRYAILPQAVRRVIPPLTNEFIILLKDTSLVIFIGLVADQRELFAIGRDLYGETFNATPYLATAAGYLAITLPMIRVVTLLEKKLRSGLAGIVG
jgi:polar amino acid transport system permease protein